MLQYKLILQLSMPDTILPFKIKIAYACGMAGWSTMTNIIIVMLPFFYLPPSNVGLVTFVPQLLVFGVVNIMSLIAASGRFFDAVYDPFIASLSDKSTNPKGRRIPFMQKAILPAVLFCCLTFYPLTKSESLTNAAWLTFTLLCFFIGTTTYIIPYNALLPELANSSQEKVTLSTFQQIGFVTGIILSAFINLFADILQKYVHVISRDSALQYVIWGLTLVAGIFMIIPVLMINEKTFSKSKPAHLPLLPALKKTFKNKNFVYYLVSDFSYYMALSIITSGLLYFITVLLKLPQSIGGPLMGLMVIVSICFYPLVTWLTKKIGKKPIILFSFGLLSLIFVTIYFLGRLPFSPIIQLYALVLSASFPLASLGILPNAILGDIAQIDAKETGENREGMFFAVKYLFVKIGQTLGIALFTFLTIYGKDPGNDYGLRLNGICGFVLCVGAIAFFSRFREQKVVA